jgi:V-type H+-transporting ATPase subunit a
MDIYGEFLPRIVFLWAIFGYLCFMIFFKWGTNYAAQNLWNIQWKMDNITERANLRGPNPGTSGAPVLLNELIFMVLPGGKPDNLFKGQQAFQYVLVVIALLMVPIMCCLKPCHHKHTVKPKIPKQKNILDEEHTDQPETDYQLYHNQQNHEEDFSEILVHQLLETIEFVLGSVSHTASYLRLWALSLAHSELATVFWDKVMFLLIEYTVNVNWFVMGLATLAGFSIWFFITLLVMMFMEGLSAFLHALRLHWVEFQSKFYKGDGHEFQPFSFARLESSD